MSFDGNLLYLGNDAFPQGLIVAESYKATPNQRQDLNSTRNALGKLHRNVVENMPGKIEFSIGAVTDAQWETIRAFITAHFTNAAERKVVARYFCPDTNDYKQEEMYMPDTSFEIERIEGTTIRYRPVALKFIGY